MAGAHGRKVVLVESRADGNDGRKDRIGDKADPVIRAARLDEAGTGLGVVDEVRTLQVGTIFIRCPEVKPKCRVTFMP